MLPIWKIASTNCTNLVRPCPVKASRRPARGGSLNERGACWLAYRTGDGIQACTKVFERFTKHILDLRECFIQKACEFVRSKPDSSIGCRRLSPSELSPLLRPIDGIEAMRSHSIPQTLERANCSSKFAIVSISSLMYERGGKSSSLNLKACWTRPIALPMLAFGWGLRSSIAALKTGAPPCLTERRQSSTSACGTSGSSAEAHHGRTAFPARRSRMRTSAASRKMSLSGSSRFRNVKNSGA